MADIAVILLAAGESRRMGEANKLLLPVGGEPLVRRTARLLASLDNARVMVVLGHEADEVRAALAGLDVELTVNPAHAEGQRSSVYHGLMQAGNATCSMVAPADMPRLTAADCASLIATHRAAPDGSVTMPMRHGSDGTERGNISRLDSHVGRPIVFRPIYLAHLHLERAADRVPHVLGLLVLAGTAHNHAANRVSKLRTVGPRQPLTFGVGRFGL